MLRHATNSLHRLRRRIYNNAALCANEPSADNLNMNDRDDTYTPYLPRHRALRHPAWRQLNKKTGIAKRTSPFSLAILMIKFRDCGGCANR